MGTAQRKSRGVSARLQPKGRTTLRLHWSGPWTFPEMGDFPIAGWFLLGKILTSMRTGDSPIYGTPHLLFDYNIYISLSQNFGDETSRFLSRTFPWKNDRLHWTSTGGFKRRLRWGAHHLIGVGSQVPTPNQI